MMVFSTDWVFAVVYTMTMINRETWPFWPYHDVGHGLKHSDI